MLTERARDTRESKDERSWVVVGAGGLLGSNFVLEARKKVSVCATFHTHPVKFRSCTTFALDVRNADACAQLFDRLRPRWVLNAAALTDVEYCEQHPNEAREINTMAAEKLARAAEGVGAGFVQISTDSVFDGVIGNYRETDRARPLNVYACTKLEGEERVRTACPDSLIVRTNFFGWGTGIKPSYNEWLLSMFAAAAPFPVFSDVSFNPVLTNTLARLILELTEQPFRGVVHLGSRGTRTKLEFACTLGKVFGIAAGQFIRPTAVEVVGLRARRPRHTNLDVGFAERLLNHPMPDLSEELVRLRESAVTGLRDELRNAIALAREN